MTSLDDELLSTINPIPTGERRKLLRACLYGDAGAGKTTLGLRCVEKKGLIISNDSAWVVVDMYPELVPLWDRMPFESFSQVSALADAHRRGVDKVAQYDTVLWDPVSVSVKRVIRNIAKANKVQVQGWPEYNMAENLLSDTVDDLNNTDLNIIYTAHIKFPNENDLKKKQTWIRPNFPEACWNVISREVQLVGYMYKEKKGSQRLIQFEGTLSETAKTQIAGIEEKTYRADDIPELIRKWKNQ